MISVVTVLLAIVVFKLLCFNFVYGMEERTAQIV